LDTSGFIDSQAGELFYERRGSSQGVPLICVHGGPGFTAHYMEPLFDLGDRRPVICYDQAGCGRSRVRCPTRKDLSIDAFVAELEALRYTCGLERMHLLGHSFGGLVVGEYALRYPERVASIVFACVSIDIPRWIEDGQRLVSSLPLMTRMVLREGLRTGDYGTPQFLAALGAYYTPRLSQVTRPALFICGRFDEATPEAHQYFSSLVPGSAHHICEQSAHHPQITERDEFLGVVRSFVDLHDNA
jgi:proline iminopeptidase